MPTMSNLATINNTNTENSLNLATPRVLDRLLFVSGMDCRIDTSDLIPVARRFLCFLTTLLKLKYDGIRAPEWKRTETEFRYAKMYGHYTHSRRSTFRAEEELEKAGYIVRRNFRLGGPSKIIFTEKLRSLLDQYPSKQKSAESCDTDLHVPNFEPTGMIENSGKEMNDNRVHVPNQKNTAPTCIPLEDNRAHVPWVAPISGDPTPIPTSDTLVCNSVPRAIDRTYAHEQKKTKPQVRKPSYKPKKPKFAQDRPTKKWINRLARSICVVSENMAFNKKLSWDDRDYIYARGRLELADPNVPGHSGVDWQWVLQTYPNMTYAERDRFVEREVIPILKQRPVPELVKPLIEEPDHEPSVPENTDLSDEDLKILMQARANLEMSRV